MYKDSQLICKQVFKAIGKWKKVVSIFSGQFHQMNLLLGFLFQSITLSFSCTGEKLVCI